MSDEAQTTPPPADAPIDTFDAAVRSREKARGIKPKDSPAGEHPKAKPDVAVDTSPATEDAPASETRPSDGDTPAAPPTDESSDLDIPAEIRSRLPTLSKEVLAWLKEKAGFEKRYKDLQREVTPLTQARSEVEKKAAMWDAVASIPDAAKNAADAIERARRGKDPASEPEDDGYDFTEHTSSENKAYIARMAKAQAQAIIDAKESERAARDEQERKRRDAIGSALASYASDNGLTPEQVIEALRVGRESLGDIQIEVGPHNISRLVDLGRQMMPTRNTKTAGSRNGEPQGLAKVASPSSRGVGTPAPSIPKWQRDGAKWPRTRQEREDYFLSLDVGNVTPES